jgi:hypothetical protein
VIPAIHWQILTLAIRPLLNNAHKELGPPWETETKPRTPQIRSHPRPWANCQPDASGIARSPPKDRIPERLTPATAVRLLPPARDGAATAPMSYLGLPLGAEARQLVSKSPNWDAGGPGTGSYNERQSARAV